MFSLRRRMENTTGHEFWTFKKKKTTSILLARPSFPRPIRCSHMSVLLVVFFFLSAGIHIIIYSPYKALYNMYTR